MINYNYARMAEKSGVPSAVAFEVIRRMRGLDQAAREDIRNWHGKYSNEEMGIIVAPVFAQLYESGNMAPQMQARVVTLLQVEDYQGLGAYLEETFQQQAESRVEPMLQWTYTNPNEKAAVISNLATLYRGLGLYP